MNQIKKAWLEHSFYVLKVSLGNDISRLLRYFLLSRMTIENFWGLRLFSRIT